jgi:hypothetical protein
MWSTVWERLRTSDLQSCKAEFQNIIKHSLVVVGKQEGRLPEKGSHENVNYFTIKKRNKENCLGTGILVKTFIETSVKKIKFFY